MSLTGSCRSGRSYCGNGRSIIHDKKVVLSVKKVGEKRKEVFTQKLRDKGEKKKKQLNDPMGNECGSYQVMIDMVYYLNQIPVTLVVMTKAKPKEKN